MVYHNQIHNDMLTFKDSACSTSIIYSVQKTTPPFRVSPAGRYLTTTEKFGLISPQIGMFPTILPKNTAFAIYVQFLNLVKMFLPLTGFSLLWGMGGIPPFTSQNLLIHPPGKIPQIGSTKVRTRVMAFFRG